ncbi:MAG TPA: hypothetical protein VFG20_21735 [Planctomycetaceae bacterium]|nr:hypothetical protein [Planctomycetaceae bacterium]
MRGPGIRLDLDVRRVWQCPACQRIRKLAGDLTSMRCQCAGEPWMHLVQERVPRQRVQKSLEARELTVESFHLTEEELAKPLPGRIRRRGFGPRPGEEPAGNAAGPPAPSGDRPSPQAGRGRPPREQRPGPGEPTTGGGGGEPANRSRPPRPQRGPRKPRFPDEVTPVQDQAPPLPPGDAPAPADEFSAGIDLPRPTDPPGAAEGPR